MANKVVLGFALLLATASLAAAGPMSRIFLLTGDSFTDRDNLFDYTNRTTPDAPVPNPEVYQPEGRYTDAAPGTWVDHLDANSTIAFRSWAISGGTACSWPDLAANNTIRDGLASDLDSQIGRLLDRYNDTEYRTALLEQDPNPVAFIWIGHMDLALGSGDDLAAQVVECIANGTRTLLEGIPEITDVVIGTLAPIGLTPWAKAQGVEEDLTTLVEEANSGIGALKETIEGEFDGRTITIWDVYAAVESAYSDSAAYNFTTVEPCLVGEPDALGLGIVPTTTCEDPSTHVFYDNIHPTTGVHALVAADLKTVLEEAGLLEAAAGGNDTEPAPVARKLLLTQA